MGNQPTFIQLFKEVHQQSLPQLSIYKEVEGNLVKSENLSIEKLVDRMKSANRLRLKTLRYQCWFKTKQYLASHFEQVSFYGTFSSTPSWNTLEQYSDLICLSIKVHGSKKGRKKRKEEILRKLSNDPYTYLMFVSACNYEINLVVRIAIELPTNTASYFKCLVSYHQETNGVLASEVVAQSGDINRLHWVTHDPNLYYNPNSYHFVRQTYIQFSSIDEHASLISPSLENPSSLGLMREKLQHQTDSIQTDAIASQRQERDHTVSSLPETRGFILANDELARDSQSHQNKAVSQEEITAFVISLLSNGRLKKGQMVKLICQAFKRGDRTVRERLKQIQDESVLYTKAGKAVRVIHQQEGQKHFLLLRHIE